MFNKFFSIIAIICFLLVFTQKGYAQTLEPVQNEQKIHGILSAGEILVFNDYNAQLSIKSSYNKATWKNNMISYKKAYSLILPREIESLYIELCQRKENESVTTCDTYKLYPMRRYIIKLDPSEKKLVIRKASD